MKPAAHSPSEKRLDNKPHYYKEHIAEALAYGLPLFSDMIRFSRFSVAVKEQLSSTFEAALMLHDMGKLDELNQPTLLGESLKRLPVDHIDAGVAVAMEMQNALLAWIIRGHHAPGLPSKTCEEAFNDIIWERLEGTELDGDYYLRGCRHSRKTTELNLLSLEKHIKTIQRTESVLREYLRVQVEECGEFPKVPSPLPESSLTTRLMLSCMVDADHLSAATFQNNDAFPEYKPPACHWDERLNKLREHISQIASTAPENERNSLRNEFYQSAINGELDEEEIVACTASVGMGKTTSVLAYLLKQAHKHQLRRIIVVAPFTNVINQTVKTFREAIVLEGEDPESIVVAHHHKAEFSDRTMRQQAVLWKAPIIVTTAVQFFETLASALPTPLRKLNSVPGSGIFIDEAHACLPPVYLSLAWHWLKTLTKSWGCRVVLASGSMVKFWENKDLVGNGATQKLPDLISDSTNTKALNLEQHRVTFKSIRETLSLNELVSTVAACGEQLQEKKVYNPCVLVIMNTVQSAAIIAHALRNSTEDPDTSEPLTNKTVLHLSTALAPEDRENILKEINRRQTTENKWQQQCWYLVATSCVEAGVDLDFAAGFRERSSVTSFLQIAGRVNRHDIRDGAILYDFSPEFEEGLLRHPGFKVSSEVFLAFWEEIEGRNFDLSDLSTRALISELKASVLTSSQSLLSYENANDFQEVMDGFRIIDSDTRTVIIDGELAEKIEQRIPVKWEEIQNKSVQIWATKIHKLDGFISELKSRNKELYVWSGVYDKEFLGYMAGIINVREIFEKHHGVF